MWELRNGKNTQILELCICWCYQSCNKSKLVSCASQPSVPLFILGCQYTWPEEPGGYEFLAVNVVGDLAGNSWNLGKYNH